jgi:hypothetical protein
MTSLKKEDRTMAVDDLRRIEIFALRKEYKETYPKSIIFYYGQKILLSRCEQM